MDKQKVSHVLDILQSAEHMSGHAALSEGILAFRCVQNLSLDTTTPAERALALNLASKTEELFYTEDDPRFNAEDVIDALTFSGISSQQLFKIATLPEEEFAALAFQACVEYRARMEDGLVPIAGPSLADMLKKEAKI